MKIRFMALALVAGAAVSSANAQTLLSYWNFNDSTPGVSGSLGILNAGGFNSNAGVFAGTLTLGGGLVANSNATTSNGAVGTFAGAVLSALPADVANNPGGALSVRGSASGSSPATSNGGFIVFNLSSLGYSTLNLKFDGRGTSTGFNNNKIETSTDGVTWVTQVASYSSTATTFSTFNYALTAAADNASTLQVRITFNGASSGSGNNRIDNFQISGTAIPTPGSLALLGLGGLVAGRRRR